jgi:hypothetical protein
MFNRVHHVSVSNTCALCIRSKPTHPALRSCSRDSLASELLGTTAADVDRCNSLYLVVSVFDNSFLNFINSCLKHFETS